MNGENQDQAQGASEVSVEQVPATGETVATPEGDRGPEPTTDTRPLVGDEVVYWPEAGYQHSYPIMAVISRVWGPGMVNLQMAIDAQTSDAPTVHAETSVYLLRHDAPNPISGRYCRYGDEVGGEPFPVTQFWAPPPEPASANTPAATATTVPLPYSLEQCAALPLLQDGQPHQRLLPTAERDIVCFLHEGTTYHVVLTDAGLAKQPVHG